MIDVTGWELERALKKLEEDMKLKVVTEEEYSSTTKRAISSPIPPRRIPSWKRGTR